MPLSFEDMRAQRPMTIPVEWKGQSLDVTYDRAAFTMEMTENRRFMPIRDRMSRVLIGWDLLKAGVPWQPLPKSDETWEKAVHAERLRQAQDGRGADNPLTDADRTEIAQMPISFEDREHVYANAWLAILLQLDPEFVRTVDAGVLDDFLGGTGRSRISANGSAPMGASAGSIGGMRT